MTLLVTVAGPDYALSCSDMRITVQYKRRLLPVDEKFNKHIYFRSEKLSANVTYTGLAQWISRGKKISIYDIISDSIVNSVKLSLDLGPLLLQLAAKLLDVLVSLEAFNSAEQKVIELHLIARHDEFPWPIIGVISTFRKEAPWVANTDLIWEYHFEHMHFYYKVAEKPEIILGGMADAVCPGDVDRLLAAVLGKADAFDISRMVSSIIERAAVRSQAVGPRSIAVVLPNRGFVDTNLWERAGGNEIIGFLPRMVFPNGMTMGPSKFPLDLQLVIEGHLPRNSLFFKGVISSMFKRRYKRLILRKKKGPEVPGLLGLIGLSLFGEVPEGCTDFGLGHDDS